MDKCANCGTLNDELANYCKACGGHVSKNYFDVLGIPINASYDTIKKAYLSAANKCHPDKTERLSPDLIKLASLKMAQLNDIWETLRDDANRTAYIASLYDEYKKSSDRFSQNDSAHNSTDERATDERAHEADGVNKKNTATNEIAPWSRWFARIIDYTVFIAILISFIHLFSPSLIVWFNDLSNAVFADVDTGYFIFAVFLSFVACLSWVPIEALLLSTAGSTLGKWLLQISILDSAGEKLTYLDALERSFNVWLRGMACGVFILSFVANYNAYKELKAERISSWDKVSDTAVLHERIGPLRFAVISIFFIQSSFLMFINWGAYQTTQALPEPAQATPSASSQPAPAATVTAIVNNASGNDKTAAKRGTATQTAVPDAIENPATAAKPAASADTQKVAAQTPSQAGVENRQPAADNRPSSSSSSAQTAKTSSDIPPAAAATEDTQDSSLKPIPDEARTSARFGQVADRPRRPSDTAKFRASREQVIACMEAYFAVMHKAIDLPLGDYVRLNKKASAEKDRCLTGG